MLAPINSIACARPLLACVHQLRRLCPAAGSPVLISWLVCAHLLRRLRPAATSLVPINWVACAHQLGQLCPSTLSLVPNSCVAGHNNPIVGNPSLTYPHQLQLSMCPEFHAIAPRLPRWSFPSACPNATVLSIICFSEGASKQDSRRHRGFCWATMGQRSSFWDTIL